MHEMGIVAGILDVARATAEHAGAARVVSVTVRIGDACAVVPESLDFAWEVLRDEDERLAHAALHVEPVPLESACEACGAHFAHDRFHCRCPVCGAAETHLVRGRELDIVSVEIETPDDSDDGA